jgi:hypothetical protein
MVCLTGAADMTDLFDVAPLPLRHLLFGSVIVKGGRLSNLDAQRASRAEADAEASPVTQLLLNDLCPTVHQFDGAFGAGGHARTAAVA